ncbi:unnamed protein product [Rotaria sp. Silwood1]|nr:unnamed protein product [Rotaria sp. Silwood1]
MATISNFEILPEEITLHVFQYLSCADIIYGFYNLNTRFNSTITYFCHSMNLIGVTYKQFDCILSNILPQISSNIRSFVVNGNWASFISNKLHATRFELTLSSMFPNLYSLILECFIDTDLIIFLKEIRDLKYLVKLDIKRLTGRHSSELLKNILTANNGRLKSVLFDQDSIFLSLKTNDKNIICSNIEELTLNLIDCDMLGDLLKLIPNVRRLRISFGQSPGISTTTLMNVSPLIQLKDFELHSYGMFWEFSNIVDILSKMPSLHRLTLDLYTDDERLANGQNLVIVLPLSLVEIQLFILYYFSESPIKTDSLLATWPKHIPVSCWLNEPDQYTIIHTIPYNVHSILIPTAIAIANSTIESSKSSAEAFGVNKYYATSEELAQDPDIDTVVVSVKVPLHKSLIMPALLQGKNAIVEWPLGRNLQEAEELTQLARSKGVKTMVGLQGRQSSVVKKMKDIISSGKLGKILSTHLYAGGILWGPTIDESKSYIADIENGANMITVLGGHSLDAMCYVLGEFESLTATTHNARKTIELRDEKGNKIRDIPLTSHDQMSVSGVLTSGAYASAHLRGGSYKGTNLLWEVEGTLGELQLVNL